MGKKRHKCLQFGKTTVEVFYLENKKAQRHTERLLVQTSPNHTEGLSGVNSTALPGCQWVESTQAQAKESPLPRGKGTAQTALQVNGQAGESTSRLAPFLARSQNIPAM